MRVRSISIGLALAVVVAAFLSGCSGRPPPAKICAAPATYSALTGIMVNLMNGAQNLSPELQAARDPERVARVLTYLAPTVSAVDETTQKVSCNAQLKVAVPREYAETGHLTVNEQGPDNITVLIAYSVQPTADSKQFVYSLEAAEDLAILALRGSYQAGPKDHADNRQEVEATAAVPVGADNQPQIGSCGPDSCSWSKVLERTVQPRGDGTLHTVRLLGGETAGDDRDPLHVQWAQNPHTVQVLCSLTEPSVTMGEQVDRLALNANGSDVPGVLMGTFSLYARECHPGAEDLGPDELAQRFGYRGPTGAG